MLIKAVYNPDPPDTKRIGDIEKWLMEGLFCIKWFYIEYGSFCACA